MGVIAHRTSGDIGQVVGARMVQPDDQLMLVTDTGRIIRIAASSIRVVQSRGSKGVRLMRLEPGERIVDMARLEEPDDDETISDEE